MGPDRSFVKAAHLYQTAKLRGHRVAKCPSGVATGDIEIDMRMPARDTRYIEMRHHRAFNKRQHQLDASLRVNFTHATTTLNWPRAAIEISRDGTSRR